MEPELELNNFNMVMGQQEVEEQKAEEYMDEKEATHYPTHNGQSQELDVGSDIESNGNRQHNILMDKVVNTGEFDSGV